MAGHGPQEILAERRHHTSNGKTGISYDWYRHFLTFMLNHEWYRWFSWVIAIGEIAAGILLIIGAFVGLLP